MLSQVILDVETKRTFDEVGGYFPEKLGVSFTGVIHRLGLPEVNLASTVETQHQFFEADLPKLWPLLQQADVIVGFNTDGFDLPALQTYAPLNLNQLPSLDLLSRIKSSAGHRVSLQALAKDTLGSEKSGHGLDAIRFFHTGNFTALAKYCMQDVKLTKDLYDYGRQHNQVKFTNRFDQAITLQVDFSLSPIPTDMQLSLL